jgi:hypothetical protein
VSATTKLWLLVGVAGAFVLAFVTNPILTGCVVVLLQLLVKVESLL